jgi:hypothetical protein
MKSEREQLRYQIELIREAMKHAGKWSESVPDWVNQYHSEAIPDIWQWLQFIYLPLRINDVVRPSQYLAPQVTAHAGGQLPPESLLLQRIVELDSLTSTLHHT